ncbi:MAG: hypothetical protein ACREQV_21550 [Candidatus Binatia bacterium]
MARLHWTRICREITSEESLIGLALAIGARHVGEWSAAELQLAHEAESVASQLGDHARGQIRSGLDPLGENFCTLRSSIERREDGATYTPKPIVAAMTAWAKRELQLGRIVDASAGSGRFLVAAGRQFKRAELLKSRASRWRRSLLAVTLQRRALRASVILT